MCYDGMVNLVMEVFFFFLVMNIDGCFYYFINISWYMDLEY